METRSKKYEHIQIQCTKDREEHLEELIYKLEKQVDRICDKSRILFIKARKGEKK